VANRSGRREAGSTAREDILQAARDLFAKNGFGNTSLRAVATRAGVDVALIPYYFGNKRGLFVAALELPVDPGAMIAAAVPGPRTGLGVRLVTAFLTTWSSPDTGPAIQAFMRTAITDADIARVVGEFASTAMLPQLCSQAEVSEDTARALAAQLFGLATLRYLIGAPAFRAPTVDELVATFGPRLQAVIDLD